MPRKTGYLANVINIPPLIFRFQYNPELLSEKKSFEYREVNNFGRWNFEGPGFNAFRALEDLRELGSLLTGTKAQEAVNGGQRTFALEFAVDARPLPDVPPEEEEDEDVEPPDPAAPLIPGDKRVGGRIEPSLAVLRSFMNPAWDPIDDVAAWIFGQKGFCPPTKPPLCNLKLGGLDVDCVMTDLNIKVTHFKPDLTPNRAEVSVSLKEQTHTLSTTLDYVARLVEVGKSYAQLEGDDWVQTLPFAGSVQNIFST